MSLLLILLSIGPGVTKMIVKMLTHVHTCWFTLVVLAHFEKEVEFGR